jgi:hypothetical protein
VAYPLLVGLGAEQTQLDADIDALLLAHPVPTQGDLIDFLKLYQGDARNIAAHALVARGLPSSTVGRALAFTNATTGLFTKTNILGVLAVASAVVSGIHGMRRHRGSIGWGLVWFLGGTVFPIVTPAVAIAQGLWKPMKKEG